MAQQTTTLKVGDVAPEFALRNAAGQEFRLTDVLHSKVAMVVFIRGTW